MVVVQVRRRRVGDEELAPVRVGTRVGHSQTPGHIKPQRRHKLVFKRKPGALRPAHAGAQRVATLDHEARDDAVKNEAIVETFSADLANSKADNLVYGHRRVVLKKLAGDTSLH